MAKCQFFRSGVINLSECAHTSRNGDASNQIKITLGFKPKAFSMFNDRGHIYIYDDAISTTQYRFAGTSVYASTKNLGGSDTNQIYSIDNDGVTLNKTTASTNVLYYSAVGEV